MDFPIFHSFEFVNHRIKVNTRCKFWFNELKWQIIQSVLVHDTVQLFFTIFNLENNHLQKQLVTGIYKTQLF